MLDPQVARRRYYIDRIAEELSPLPAPTEDDFYAAKQRLLPPHGDDPDAMIVASITWPDLRQRLALGDGDGDDSGDDRTQQE